MRTVTWTRLLVILCCVFLATAWFVWPTPYTYHRETRRHSRINRFTGETTYDYSGRWLTHFQALELSWPAMARQNEANEGRTREILPALKAIGLVESPLGLGRLIVRNPTKWRVMSGEIANLLVEYFRLDSNGSEILVRSFKSSTAGVEPHSDCELILNVGGVRIPEIGSLPRGTTVVQRTVIRYGIASDRVYPDGSGNTIRLRPALEIQYARRWKTVGETPS